MDSQCLCVADDEMVKKVSLFGEVRVDTICESIYKRGKKAGPFLTFNCLQGIVVDPHSQNLYVACDHSIAKIVDKKRIVRSQNWLNFI